MISTSHGVTPRHSTRAYSAPQHVEPAHRQLLRREDALALVIVAGTAPSRATSGSRRKPEFGNPCIRAARAPWTGGATSSPLPVSPLGERAPLSLRDLRRLGRG